MEEHWVGERVLRPLAEMEPLKVAHTVTVSKGVEVGVLSSLREAVAELHKVAEAQAVLAAEALRVMEPLAVVEEEVEGDLLVDTETVLLEEREEELLKLPEELGVALTA
jgi:hypothetical protein